MTFPLPYLYPPQNPSIGLFLPINLLYIISDENAVENFKLSLKSNNSLRLQQILWINLKEPKYLKMHF